MTTMKLIIHLALLLLPTCLSFIIQDPYLRPFHQLGTFKTQTVEQGSCCQLWDPTVPALKWGKWAAKNEKCISYLWNYFRGMWIPHTYNCGTSVICKISDEDEERCGQILIPKAEIESQPSGPEWNLEFEVPITNSLKTSVYKSNKTGMTLVHVKTDTPIVHGYFSLSTEPSTDQGLPHTLEHLIFQGSSGYPYYGILDDLAERTLSGGTNAWTAQDHTCYTMSTGGSSGFLTMLPIYLDHILHPILTNGTYKTEVHRINAKGEDVGVVYAEMQGREGGIFEVMDAKHKELLYPEDEGYWKSSGGKLKNIREETSIGNIRDYHQKFYRPENLFLIITGPIDAEDIFDRLEEVEDKWIREKSNLGAFKKPWQKSTPVPPSKTVEVEYDSEDETSGYVNVGWRKNSSILGNTQEIAALDFLMSYLTLSKIGPLDLEMVNTQDSSVASSVYSWSESLKEPIFFFGFSTVPEENLTHIVPKMDAILKSIYEEGREAFAKNHLKSIHGLIDSSNLAIQEVLVNNPQSQIQDVATLYQIYGNEKGDFEVLLQRNLQSQNYLKGKSAQFWLDILKRTLIDAPKAVVRARPSKKLEDLNEQEEKERISLRNSTLDHHQLQVEEDDAKASQIKASKEIIEKVPLADIDSISFRKVNSFSRRNNPASTFSFEDFPFEISLSDVDSSYVHLTLAIAANNLTLKQKQLLPLLMAQWFDSPLLKDGVLTPLDELLQRQTKIILYLSAYNHKLSIDGESQDQDVISIFVQCKLDDLDATLEYLHDVLFFSHPDPKVVKLFVKQSLDSVPEEKQSPWTVQSAVFDSLLFEKNNVDYINSFLPNTAFLEDLLKQDFNTTVKELKDMMKLITGGQKNMLHIVTNLKELIGQHEKSYKKIANILREDLNQKMDKPRPKDIQEFPIPAPIQNKIIMRIQDIPLKHWAVGASDTDSCYLKQLSDFNVMDYNDPELAQVSVLFTYISNQLHRRVRAKGFLYGVGVYKSMAGYIGLSVYKSPHLVDAVQEIRKILNQYSSGNTSVWETNLLEAAKREIIFYEIWGEETVDAVMSGASANYFAGKGNDYTSNYVNKVANVSIDDLNRLSMKYLPKFFQEDSSLTIITCSPTAIDQVVEDLSQNLGYNVAKYQNIDAAAEKLNFSKK